MAIFYNNIKSNINPNQNELTFGTNNVPQILNKGFTLTQSATNTINSDIIINNTLILPNNFTFAKASFYGNINNIKKIEMDKDAKKLIVLSDNWPKNTVLIDNKNNLNVNSTIKIGTDSSLSKDKIITKELKCGKINITQIPTEQGMNIKIEDNDFFNLAELSQGSFDTRPKQDFFSSITFDKKSFESYGNHFIKFPNITSQYSVELTLPITTSDGSSLSFCKAGSRPAYEEWSSKLNDHYKDITEQGTYIIKKGSDNSIYAEKKDGTFYKTLIDSNYNAIRVGLILSAAGGRGGLQAQNMAFPKTFGGGGGGSGAAAVCILNFDQNQTYTLKITESLPYESSDRTQNTTFIKEDKGGIVELTEGEAGSHWYKEDTGEGGFTYFETTGGRPGEIIKKQSSENLIILKVQEGEAGGTSFKDLLGQYRAATAGGTFEISVLSDSKNFFINQVHTGKQPTNYGGKYFNATGASSIFSSCIGQQSYYGAGGLGSYSGDNSDSYNTNPNVGLGTGVARFFY